MELPKIPNDQLPKEIKEIVGDADAHFDLVVDPTEIIDVPLDTDEYFEGKYQVQKMLIENRKRSHEYHESKRNNRNSKTNHQGTEGQQETVD